MIKNQRTFWSKLVLLLFPVAIVLVLLAIEIFVQQHILFTSLVSSIFLIYLRPDDVMNNSLTIFISQVLAAIIGYGGYIIFGSTYTGACLTVIVVALLLASIKQFHPPAIATSLIFQFRTHSESDLVLFGLLVGLITILFVMKKIYNYLNKKFSH